MTHKDRDKVNSISSWPTFDACIGRAFSGNDSWADHGIVRAGTWVQTMTPDDFMTLRACWRSRSIPWQLRCAEALSFAPAAEAVQVLLEMLNAAEDAVVIAAADTLGDFNPDAIAGNICAESLLRLQEVAVRNPGLSAAAVQRLLSACQRNQNS